MTFDPAAVAVALAFVAVALAGNTISRHRTNRPDHHQD